jgi:hypothetical protein
MNEETIVVCNEKWLNEGYNNKDKKKNEWKINLIYTTKALSYGFSSSSSSLSTFHST